MRIRVVDAQAFGHCSGVELAIGGDEGEGAEAGGSIDPVDFERGRELHGIVRAQPMSPRQSRRIGEQGRGQVPDDVTPREMTTEVPQDGPGLGR
jgi:hypothetical protein